MKKLGIWSCLLSMILCCTAYAADMTQSSGTSSQTHLQQESSVRLSIQADELTCKRLSELEEDEIYLMLTIMDKEGKHAFKRIPEAPEIFIFKSGDTKTHLPLWEGVVSTSKPLEIFFALVEHDAALVDPDDLLGVAKVVLKVENGKLNSQWDIPHSKYTAPTRLVDRNNKPEFDMYGDSGHYYLRFSTHQK